MKSFTQYIVEDSEFVQWDPFDGDLPFSPPNQSPAPWYQEEVDDHLLNPTNWPEGPPGWQNIHPNGVPGVDYYKEPPLWGGRNRAPWMNPFDPTETDTGWGYRDPLGHGRPYGPGDFHYYGPVHVPDGPSWDPWGPRDPSRGPEDKPIDPFDIIDDYFGR